MDDVEGERRGRCVGVPRPADPQRRREVLDAVIDQLAATGIGSFSLRTLAAGIGQSTRVLTHHFADKNALLTAVLARLDERQHTALRSTPGWYDPAVKVGSLVRSAWERNLGSDELAMTRLFREIEGLAAASTDCRSPAPGSYEGVPSSSPRAWSAAACPTAAP